MKIDVGLKKQSVIPEIQNNFKNYHYFMFLFGYDYLSYHPHFFVRFLRKCFCFGMALSTSCYFLYYQTNYHFAVLCTIIVIEYFLNVLSSCIWKKACNLFFLQMRTIDARLGVGVSYYKKISIIYYIIAFYSIIMRLINLLSYCFFFTESCAPSIFISVVSSYIYLAVDISQIPRVTVFCITRHKIKLLRQNVETNILYPSLKISDRAENVRTIRKALSIYKDILDTIDEIAGPINRLYFMSLLLSFPKLMLFIYNILLLCKSGASAMGLVPLCIEVFQVALLSCLPGVVNEMITAETDKMKLSLMHYRLWACEGSERLEIDNFLKYLELRPFKYRIWRLIPVDLSLPVGLISLCTTYLIVIIQFTHLYE